MLDHRAAARGARHERLDYNLLFRWFVGLNADDPVWDVTVFTKNRTRFIDGLVAQRFFAAVVAQARAAGLLSDEHFSVDGTLIEAWAGQKSFQPKDGSGGGASAGGTGDFKGQRRRNDTHQSRTDEDARLYRKGDSQAAELCYLGHVLTENRSGLAVGGMVSLATGTGERESALALLGPPGPKRRRRITLGCDKAYDTAAFVAALRERGITPHVLPEHHQSPLGDRWPDHPARGLRAEPSRAAAG